MTAYGRAMRSGDTVERAKIEHEARMTLVLAVLVSWIPFACILTLVAGLGRWGTARRAWGGHDGRAAVLVSALSILAWAAILALAG